MAWVVDTCILLDIGLDDSEFAICSERLLRTLLPEGLLICPISFVELAPAFSGERNAQEEFLFQLGVGHEEGWLMEDTVNACEAWTRHIQVRRRGQGAKRPIADVLIGAFALRHQGLITRNTADFQKLFPTLPLLSP